MSKMPPAQTARCPECQTLITITEPIVGRLLMCSHCEEILRVSSISPFALDWGFEEPFTKTDQNQTEGHYPLYGNPSADV